MFGRGGERVGRVTELWETGGENGAAALGIEAWEAIEVDTGHRSLEGVSPEHQRAALLAGCGADVVVGAGLAPEPGGPTVA